MRRNQSGRCAPCASSQVARFQIVVRDREILKALATYGEFAGHIAGARVGIALVLQADDVRTNTDEGRLAQNLMLAA